MELSTKRIRELIACPQFGDDHYGEWGCLAYDQRKAILHLVETIDRQQAEVERLTETSEEAVSCFHRMESLYNIKCMELKVAKTEAYKEFAERLCDGRVSNDPVVIEAKALLKELTEEAAHEIRKDLADM